MRLACSLSYFLFSGVFLLVWLSITGFNFEPFGVHVMLDGFAYLPIDSNLYLETNIHELHHINVSGMGTNYLPVLIGDISQWLSPEQPYLFVLLLNFFLLNIAFLVFLKLVPRKNCLLVFVIWLLLPLSYFSMTSLNKEVLSFVNVIFFLSFLVKYSEKKQLRFLVGMACVMTMAFFTRNLLFLAELGAFFYIFVRVKKVFWVSLILASLILPFVMVLTNGHLLGDSFYNIQNVASEKSMQTGKIFEQSTQLYNYPFGFIVSYFIHGAIYLFAPMLNPRYIEGLFVRINLSEMFLVLSSIYVSIILILLLIRYSYNIL